ncbi:hypothetical protein QA436_000128 [Escherichia coli]|nr:hypothetical protein [Escherichia coli]
MSTITKEWLQQKIADMEATRDEIPFGLDEDDSNTLAAMKLAQASLEAEKEYKHHSVISEQLAHVLSSMDATDHQRAVISCAVDRLNNVSQLLQSSPSALLVPEMLDYQGAKELYNYLMTEEETNATVNGWNACRAAMLQGAEPVTTDYKLPELTDSQCLEFLAVAFRHASIKGDIEFDDIRLGLKMALESAPQQEVKP